MTADKLDKRVSVLQLTKNGSTWSFETFHETRACIELLRQRNIFSASAASADSYKLTMRRQTVTPFHSLLWEDKRLLITAVDDYSDRHTVTATAAAVMPVTVTRKMQQYGKNALNNPVKLEPVVLSFPAWLAEKYVKLSADKPQNTVEQAYVLIVPKAVDVIEVGDVITVFGESFAVEVQHLLDPVKNEYEIVARRDS